jgi:hypothetical protein
MRIVTYRSGAGERAGVQTEDGTIDAASAQLGTLDTKLA